MPAPSKFVIVNNLRLHYLDFGNESAPPVVCVHGLTANAHSFDAVGERLSRRYHVIAIDVRGRGESQWGPPAEYSIPYYVGDLAGFLEAFRIPRMSLIGTSMGGIISMSFAAVHPDKVECIVLNDIGPEIDPRGLQRIMDYVIEPPPEFANMAEVVQYYRDTYPPIAHEPEPVVIEWVKSSVKPTGHGTLTWKMDPAVREALRPTSSTPTQQVDLWQPFATLKMPTLLVRGAESDILSPQTAARMCSMLPNAWIVEVPGVGHAPSLSEPEAVAALSKFFGL